MFKKLGVSSHQFCPPSSTEAVYLWFARLVRMTTYTGARPGTMALVAKWFRSVICTRTTPSTDWIIPWPKVIGYFSRLSCQGLIWLPFKSSIITTWNPTALTLGCTDWWSNHLDCLRMSSPIPLLVLQLPIQESRQLTVFIFRHSKVTQLLQNLQGEMTDDCFWRFKTVLIIDYTWNRQPIVGFVYCRLTIFAFLFSQNSSVENKGGKQLKWFSPWEMNSLLSFRRNHFVFLSVTRTHTPFCRNYESMATSRLHKVANKKISERNHVRSESCHGR